MSDPITASAEATKAVAETTGQLIETTREAGHFASKLFGKSLEDIAAVAQMRTSMWRMNNLVRYLQKADAKLASVGNPAIRNHIVDRLALPLLEAVSEEDDPGLEELWVNYLCNGLTAPGGGFITKHLTETVRRFEPDDACVLPVLYKALLDDEASFGIVTLDIEEVRSRCGLEAPRLQASIERFESLGLFWQVWVSEGAFLTSESERSEDAFRILNVQAGFGSFQSTSLLRSLGRAVLPTVAERAA